MSESVYSAKRACPSCARSFPELDPRLFSFNSKHGWCAACYGTGLKIDEVDWDEERQKTGAEDHVLDSWLEWLEIDETCPECDGQRLNREARAVRYREQSIAELTALPVAQARRRSSATSRSRAAKPRSRATSCPSCSSRLGFLEQVGLSLSRARSRGADALGRRSAAHPPRRAARLEPARRVLHPRRADDRPASARQPRPARHARARSRRRATR